MPQWCDTHEKHTIDGLCPDCTRDHEAPAKRIAELEQELAEAQSEIAEFYKANSEFFTIKEERDKLREALQDLLIQLREKKFTCTCDTVKAEQALKGET